MVLVIFAAALMPMMSGCYDSDDVGDSYHTFTGDMISDFIQNDSDLTLFNQAVQKAGVSALLKSYGKYTVFAPSNAAMQAWMNKNGMRIEEMDSATVRAMVYYHIMDGESNAVKAFLTSDFPEGSFPIKNMEGRYLTAAVRTGVGNWCIKNGDDYTDLISANNEEINGVVHVVNGVLEGNNDLLSDFVMNNSRYAIFGQALKATGWADSLRKIDDSEWAGKKYTVFPDGGTEVRKTSNYCAAMPQGKKLLYMCFAESDSIMALREGIHSLDDLRAYAKRVYPDGADIADETDVDNSLHKFIGYHLYDVQRAKNKLVVNKQYVSFWDWFTWFDYICDNNYRVEQYYIPMQPKMLLSIQNANTKTKDVSSNAGIPVLNCPYSPYNPDYSAMPNADELNGWPIIRILDGESDQYCQNGILHGINNMLVYTDDVLAQVFHRRLRFDVRTFMPEAVNNDLVYDSDKGYNWFYSSFPDGYCKNIEFASTSNTNIKYEGTTPHNYLLGDYWKLTGNFDITINVGPLPRGSYEVRIGYNPGGSGAVVQAYIDGEPCGIPLDTRVSPYNGNLGWIQDWLAIQESGSSRFAGMGESEEDPYGLENDKNLRNHGFMKAPNSYVGVNYHNLGYGDNLTARNVDYCMRKILGIFNWTGSGTHKLRLVAMRPGNFNLDYVEFIPTDLVEDEDQH